MINIPIAQSIRFRPINNDLPNFDNTFAADVEGFPYAFTQYVNPETIPIQVVTPDDNESLAYLDLIHNGTRTRIVDESTTFIGALKYNTFPVTLASFSGQCCYMEAFLEVNGGGEVLSYRSERFTVLAQPKYLRLDWFNSENSFQMDYSAGLVHSMWVEAKQWKLKPGGSSSIYVNQGEEVKLKSIYQRIFLLECEVPYYVAEQMIMATDHDRFYINSIEFVTTEKPTITQLGQSAMYSFSAEVKQKTIVGLNTHDVG